MTSLLERALMRVLPHFDITSGCESDPASSSVYLRRFFLRRAVGEHARRQAFIHHILRSDADRERHCHPWPFVSIIPAGGYFEVTASGREWIAPGRILRRGATWQHRVELPEGRTAWTLVFTGPKEKSWFFWAGEKATPWREFLAAKCAPGEAL
jgi:hypothetical protein